MNGHAFQPVGAPSFETTRSRWNRPNTIVQTRSKKSEDLIRSLLPSPGVYAWVQGPVGLIFRARFIELPRIECRLSPLKPRERGYETGRRTRAQA